MVDIVVERSMFIRPTISFLSIHPLLYFPIVVPTHYPTLESGEQLKSSEKEKCCVRPIPSVELPQGNIRLSVVSIAISDKTRLRASAEMESNTTSSSAWQFVEGLVLHPLFSNCQCQSLRRIATAEVKMRRQRLFVKCFFIFVNCKYMNSTVTWSKYSIYESLEMSRRSCDLNTDNSLTFIKPVALRTSTRPETVALVSTCRFDKNI
jgi:hypothetical protein